MSRNEIPIACVQRMSVLGKSLLCLFLESCFKCFAALSLASFSVCACAGLKSSSITIDVTDSFFSEAQTKRNGRKTPQKGCCFPFGGDSQISFALEEEGRVAFCRLHRACFPRETANARKFPEAALRACGDKECIFLKVIQSILWTSFQIKGHPQERGR